MLLKLMKKKRFKSQDAVALDLISIIFSPLAQFFVFFFVCLFGWLVGWLVGWLTGLGGEGVETHA